MMSIEAVISLLALMIVVAGLPQAQYECEAGAVYRMQLAHDAALVLAKKGTLDRFANWDGIGTDEAIAADLEAVGRAGEVCVGIADGEKRAASCRREIGSREVWRTSATAIGEGGPREIEVAVWKE